MAVKCPKCNQKKMIISSNLELPGDSRSDEISLQILECLNCDFKGIGVYEESRRGAIDSDSYDHRGYIVNEETLQFFREKIKQCTQPRNTKCECNAHRHFYKLNMHGRWSFLDEVKIKNSFNIFI